MPVDGETLRRTTLQVVADIAQQPGGQLSSTGVLNEAARRLQIRHNREDEQALLTFWFDLFRTGYLAWGLDLANPDLPWCHLTEQGRRALATISRDPANPDGYIAHLAARATVNAIALSYVREALATFNAGCSKATAVMIGVAAESLVLSLRDALVSKMASLGQTPTADLQDWRIKRVLDSIEASLTARAGIMTQALRDSFAANWPAFTHQIRAARNDAGHPAAIDPVTQDGVHASLLIFPELARLAGELETWVGAQYR